VRIEESGEADAELIEARLLDALRSDQPQSVNTSFVLTLKNESDELNAGLTASTSYGWLLIKTLWVAQSQRRSGLGRSLVTDVETKARDIGCHAAWLDTSSAPAKAFYKSLGYSVFADLTNEPSQTPGSHSRWFMKKTL